ncbi:MAG: hypothetical protein AB7P17_14845 [Nitrospirales bacterium]
MRRDFKHNYLPTGLLWIGTTYDLKIAGYPWNELKEKRDETMQEHSTHRRMIDQSPETPIL